MSVVPSPTGGDVSADSGGVAETGGNDASATTDQAASSSATATQQQPTNVVVIVRINSPGDDGPISQTNVTVATSGASNSATTSQGAGSGDSGSSESASTGQQAGGTATATQDGAGNIVVVVRLKSPGDNGPVSQTNVAGADSSAANTSSTTQGAPSAAPAAQSAPPPAEPSTPKRRDAPKKTVATAAGAPQPAANATAPQTTPPAATPVSHASKAIHPAPAHRPTAGASHRHHPVAAALTSIARSATRTLPPFPIPAVAAPPARPQDLSRPVLLALLAVGLAVGTLGAMRQLPGRRSR